MTSIRHLLAAAGAAALMGIALPALAAPRTQAAAQDEQRALDAIVRAQIDLKRHQGAAARNDAAKAETVLLNAQQAGTYKDLRSLAALERAHRDFLARQWSGAATQLKTAERSLMSPHMG
jgi:hypothetical protein